MIVYIKDDSEELSLTDSPLFGNQPSVAMSAGGRKINLKWKVRSRRHNALHSENEISEPNPSGQPAGQVIPFSGVEKLLEEIFHLNKDIVYNFLKLSEQEVLGFPSTVGIISPIFPLPSCDL
jgi:hypothetical protein